MFMEKLIKSINGQWRLEKANDEVRNRRAQQVDAMQEKGQGDVKANAGESIFNIPKEATNFNPEKDLFHPNAADPLHRMDQDEWERHRNETIADPRLTREQFDVLNQEEDRRRNVINQDHDKREAEEKRQREINAAAKKQRADLEQRKDETKQEWHNRLIRENPREAIRIGALIEGGKSFTEKDSSGRVVVRHLDRAPVEASDIKADLDKDPNKVMDFSAAAVAKRNAESKEMENISKEKVLNNWKQLRDRFHGQMANPIMMQRLKDSVRRGNVEYVKQFAHIIPVVDKDGKITDYNIVKKNHPSETLEQYMNPQAAAEESSSPKNQIGQDLEDSKPKLPETANLISADDVPQAGTGIGVGRVISPEEKKQIHSTQFAPRGSTEAVEADRRSEKMKRKIFNDQLENERTMREAEKNK